MDISMAQRTSKLSLSLKELALLKDWTEKERLRGKRKGVGRGGGDSISRRNGRIKDDGV